MYREGSPKVPAECFDLLRGDLSLVAFAAIRLRRDYFDLGFDDRNFRGWISYRRCCERNSCWTMREYWEYRYSAQSLLLNDPARRKELLQAHGFSVCVGGAAVIRSVLEVLEFTCATVLVEEIRSATTHKLGNGENVQLSISEVIPAF